MYDEFVVWFGCVVLVLCVVLGMELGVIIGLMINWFMVDKICVYVDDVLGKGGRIFVSGSGCEDGNFVLFVVIGGVMLDMIFVEEEIFGLVVLFYCFGSENEVFELVNVMFYGFVSYFYICDFLCVFCVVEWLEVGMVGFNIGSLVLEMVFFGGVK